MYRYYFCLRSAPRNAAQFGRPVCLLPQMPAERAEAYALSVVKATLLQPDRLRAAIAATRDEGNDAERHAGRVAELEAIIRRKTAALERAVRDYAEAESESEREAFGVVKGLLAREVDQLKADVTVLRDWKPRGITRDEETHLLAFTDEIASGVDALTMGERREVCELLRLRGRCRTAGDGPILSGRARFAIDLTGEIALSDSVPNSTYFELLHEPPAMSSDDFQWYLAEPLRLDADGNLVAPTRPGLGVEPDPDKLAAFRLA